MHTKLKKDGVSFMDSMNPNWNMETDIIREFDYKTTIPILLIPITKESRSFGILGELPWLIIYSLLNGTKIACYIEDRDPHLDKDSFRTRTLVKAHLSKILEQYPNLFFMADSMEQLTNFGIYQAKQLANSLK